ncbi:uncharacterized protein LOC109803418 isoform X3 [Cajanus cajan]|uniref:uncharacterized protein LOC109803418 isoform X3 n=1 Tax=Cajanus cajan TaxID=3821 RepID=UPI00098DD637|nr:uncharacterized protein LOC109803418 isoform X3 [Cajanus cajan]
MYRSQRFKPLLARTPLQPNPFPSTFSLKCKFTSLAPQHHSFTVSYLINNCAFSPETALKASERVRFDTAEKPDSVIAFFRNNGFSNSQINSIFRRIPDLLTCNPHKRVLPKFQFLASKGASNSDIVQLVNRCPRLLTSSLENNVIPTFELGYSFGVSHGKTTNFCLMGWCSRVEVVAITPLLMGGMFTLSEVATSTLTSMFSEIDDDILTQRLL